MKLFDRYIRREERKIKELKKETKQIKVKTRIWAIPTDKAIINGIINNAKSMLDEDEFEKFKDNLKIFHDAFVMGYLTVLNMTTALKIKCSPEEWRDFVKKCTIFARIANFLVDEKRLKGMHKDVVLGMISERVSFQEKMQTDLFQAFPGSGKKDAVNITFTNAISDLICSYLVGQGYNSLAASLSLELANEYGARSAEILGQNNTAEPFRSMSRVRFGEELKVSEDYKFVEILKNVHRKILGCLKNLKNKQGWNEVEMEVKKIENVKRDEVERLSRKIDSKLNTWKREGYKIDDELEKYRNELNKELNLLRIIDNAKDEYYKRVLQQLGVSE